MKRRQFCRFAAALASGLAVSAMAARDLIAAPSDAAKSFDLGAHRGKVVYLDFWASWCSPCLKSFPWMKKMQEIYGREGLVIVAVNADSSREAADAFLRKTAPNFAIAYDADGKLFAEYRLRGLPTAIVFDRAGVERERHVGWREEQSEAYEAGIRALLRAKARPSAPT